MVGKTQRQAATTLDKVAGDDRKREIDSSYVTFWAVVPLLLILTFLR